MIEHYEHHGVTVAVQSHLKGKHREHCLCYQGCKWFKPGEDDNCFIAQELYEFCVNNNMTTPVFECASFIAK
jgi:hypothetical protein